MSCATSVTAFGGLHPYSFTIRSCPLSWRAELGQRCGTRVPVLPLGAGSAILPVAFGQASDMQPL